MTDPIPQPAVIFKDLPTIKIEKSTIVYGKDEKTIIEVKAETIEKAYEYTQKLQENKP
jgi:hypothetical protein